MLYNSNSSAAPANIVEDLDITHRKHLRRILNVHWPHGCITNKELYKRCDTTKLSERVTKMRWTMLGHVLRSNRKSPAFTSLTFAMTNGVKSRKGRHQMNLMQVIKSDLRCRKFDLKNIEDIYILCDIASDRGRWREAFREDLLKSQAVS